MCPPVSVRRMREGMTYLYAAWAYQLEHGEPLRLCFPCFKVAFMDMKDSLLSEAGEQAWGEEAEEGPGQAGGAQSPLQTAQPMQWGMEDLIDLEPHDVVRMNPEEADWTQALPWRFQALPPCTHWPRPPPPWQVSASADLCHREPMLLELGTSFRMDPREAEACLLGLQVISAVAASAAIYLQKMAPGWILPTRGQRWKMLLEPREVWAVPLPGLPPERDLQRWKLSVVERVEQGTMLVPADSALQKRGFTVISYLPWSARGGGAGAEAAAGQGPGPQVFWSNVPWKPGETLAILGDWGLGDRPYFLPLGPEPQDFQD